MAPDKRILRLQAARRAGKSQMMLDLLLGDTYASWLVKTRDLLISGEKIVTMVFPLRYAELVFEAVQGASKGWCFGPAVVNIAKTEDSYEGRLVFPQTSQGVTVRSMREGETGVWRLCAGL